MNFNELNLPEYVLRALEKNGYTTPTEIQQKAIPPVMKGLDLVGKSQTGSGKTFAYGIPAICVSDSLTRQTEVLVLCPTRELAMQITAELRKLNEFKEGVKVVPIYGGASMERQIISLKQNAKIVVGTPGRVIDHIRRRTLKLKNVKLLVLDEADEMLNMGFRDDMEKIIKETNPYRQTVMFSATMPKPILDIAETYMKEPEYIEINRTNENVSVEQKFVYVGEKAKSNTLLYLTAELKPSRAIVFCNTKKMAEKVCDILKRENYSAKALHGDMKQADRKKVITEMKEGNLNYLVATDVAARGLDITDVDCIINYDIPKQTEFYTHRIGRTARAGKTGVAYTIINNRYQLSDLDNVMAETKNEITEYVCPFSVSEYKKTKSGGGSKGKNGYSAKGTVNGKKYGKGKQGGKKPQRVREGFKGFNEYKKEFGAKESRHSLENARKDRETALSGNGVKKQSVHGGKIKDKRTQSDGKTAKIEKKPLQKQKNHRKN